MPVPEVLWFEDDPGVLGAPFLVMERVDGRVPPDVMPYTMDGWLREAPAADQRALQDATVGVLAALHAIGPGDCDLSFLAPGTDDAPHSTRTGRLGARRHVVHWRGYYEWVGAGGGSLSSTRVRPHRGEGPGVEEPAALAGATPASHRVLPRFEPAASSTGRWQAWRPRVDSVFASCTVLRRHRRMLGWTACPTSPAAASPDAYDGRGGANGRHGLIQLYAALRHGIVMARGHAGRELRGDDVARRSRRRVHAPLLLEAMLDGSWRPSAER